MKQALRFAFLLALCWVVTVPGHGYNRGYLEPSAEASLKPVMPIDDLAAWEKRAENGDLEAQYTLGVDYIRGDGVAQNANGGLTWLKKAADAGYGPAANFLGMLYFGGGVVTPDEELSVSYYRRAIALGDVDAKNNFAILFKDGWGVPKDMDAALALFEDAASRDCAAAAYNVGYLSEMDENPQLEKAVRYYFKAARLGNTSGMVALALLYADGKGVQKDLHFAQDVLRQAIERGDPNAFWVEGFWHVYGPISPIDMKEGFVWFKRAADRGNIPGEFNAAYALQFGEGVEKNAPLAATYYEKCSVKLPACRINLAVMYEHGEGVPQNRETAFQLMKQATEGGTPMAIANLGRFYYNGIGVPKDDAQALKVLRSIPANWEVVNTWIGTVRVYSNDPAVKDIPAGIAAFELAVKQSPNRIQPILNLESAYLYAGMPDKALDAGKKAISLEPETPGGYLALSRFYRDNNAGALRDNAMSIEWAVKADTLTKHKNPEVLNALAETYFDLEKYDQAFAAAADALALEPESALYANNLAWWLATAKDSTVRDPKRAISLAQKAISVEPNYASYIDTLAEAYFANGEYAKAVEYEQKAANLEPTKSVYQESLARFRAAAKGSDAKTETTGKSDSKKQP